MCECDAFSDVPNNVCRSQSSAGNNNSMRCALLLRSLSQAFWIFAKVAEKVGQLLEGPLLLKARGIGNGVC
jgi:hypothetical protein